MDKLYDLSAFADSLVGELYAPKRSGKSVWYANSSLILRWDGSCFRLESRLPHVSISGLGNGKLRLAGWYLGEPYFENGLYWLFNDGGIWTVADCEPRPMCQWLDADGLFRGDGCWRLSNFPTPESSAVGTWSGPNEQNDIEAVWTEESPYWISDSLLGEYTDPEGRNAPRTVGVPRFLDAGGNEYVRSVETENGYYTYGKVHFENGTWCIGSPSDESGYWTGSEPSRTSPTVFAFQRPAGSDVWKDDITLTFDAFTFPQTADLLYFAEVAKWA